MGRIESCGALGVLLDRAGCHARRPERVATALQADEERADIAARAREAAAAVRRPAVALRHFPCGAPCWETTICAGSKQTAP